LAFVFSASHPLTRISGSSEHQKILEQLKSDNQSKSDQVLHQVLPAFFDRVLTESE